MPTDCNSWRDRITRAPIPQKWAEHPFWGERFDFTITSEPYHPTVEMSTTTLTYRVQEASWFRPRAKGFFITECHWTCAHGKRQTVSRATLNRTFHLLIERVEATFAAAKDLLTFTQVLLENKQLPWPEIKRYERPVWLIKRQHFAALSLAEIFGAHLEFLADVEQGKRVIPSQWWRYPFPINFDELYDDAPLWFEDPYWYTLNESMSDFAFRLADFIDKNGLSFSSSTLALLDEIRANTEELRRRFPSCPCRSCATSSAMARVNLIDRPPPYEPFPSALSTETTSTPARHQTTA